MCTLSTWRSTQGEIRFPHLLNVDSTRGLSVKKYIPIFCVNLPQYLKKYTYFLSCPNILDEVYSSWLKKTSDDFLSKTSIWGSYYCFVPDAIECRAPLLFHTREAWPWLPAMVATDFESDTMWHWGDNSSDNPMPQSLASTSCRYYPYHRTDAYPTEMGCISERRKFSRNVN